MYKNEKSRAKELNRVLQNSQIKPEQLLESDYPAITIHSNSTIFFANRAFCDIVQYTEDEILGLNAWLLFPPESIELITQKLKEKSTSPYQVRARTKDGSLIEVELKGINFELAGEQARAILVKVIN